MAKLNVWISGMDDPCSVDSRTWYVTIFDCDGHVLEWCKKRYIVMPAKCGHLEVEVPPGCYYIKAVWSYRPIVGGYRCNHFTDAAIVQACCDQTACVKLFNPTIHRCGTIFVKAITDMIRDKTIKPEIVKQIETAIAAGLANVPKPQKQFELAYMDEIEKLVLEQEAKVDPKNPG
ncbi:MAG: hypothetical protein NT007_19030 [Candidatus Kapabacteria bacterium]|nr:hypothetical protein [Candidatus Kapabacteria bacterium]